MSLRKVSVARPGGSARRLKARPAKPAAPKFSRLRKPADMSLEAWQIALRREYGGQQDFQIKNLGGEPIFSDFEVTNPASGRTYRVAIRGQGLGENYCSCPDFAVNTLGTCKHVEFALAWLGRRRGAKAALALGFHPDYSQVYLQYGAQREVVIRPGTACPKGLAAYARRFFDDHGRLKLAAVAGFDAFLARAKAGSHEVRCYDDALAFIAQCRDRARLAQSINDLFPRGPRSAAFKKLLKTDLYPYQRAGALFASKAGRCLIADDMGLGKTIQALAAAEILARTAGIERVLIVAPTSLKHQWRNEIERFTDRTVAVVEGLQPRRAELYAADFHFKIVNYDVVHRDLDLIRRWQPELIVLDEAQRIKNWKTRAAQTVKRLESEFAFVLTGTPLENRLEELHSIVEFVDRFRLGPMFRFLAEHQHVDETGRVVGYRGLSNISRTLEPILLRRTKDKVLKELPERMEKRFFVPMTPQQMDHHEENREIVARIVRKWRRYGFLRESDQRRMRIALQNMRMACNSTYLLDPNTDHGNKTAELIELLSETLENKDAKVVVFSQWVRMHELVVRRLAQQRWEHVFFHGGVPGPRRKDLIKQFREDPRCRLFLSTDAGGVGLNLQNASSVVILDQPWNPAVLEQRIGRVHRLGQHRPVRVAHFIAQGTIEEGMLSLLEFKQSVFRGVLDEGQDEVFLGGTRLKRFIESVEKATGSIPEAVPEESGEPAASPAERAAAAALPQVVDGAWNDVAAAGLGLLESLAKVASAGSSPFAGGAPPPSLAALVARDDATGQPYLRLPLPQPETIQKIVDLLGALVRREH
ncbi:MAG: DEAD/DEAH box helicase [Pirellulales bacterium]|nr:DEAD/DEAH box helicase [Pirellulales bacterium]